MGWSCKASNSRLVRNVAEVDVKMILEHLHIPMLTVPELDRQQIKQLHPLYSKTSFSGSPNTGRSRPVDLVRDSFPTSSGVKVCEAEVIPLN